MVVDVLETVVSGGVVGGALVVVVEVATALVERSASSLEIAEVQPATQASAIRTAIADRREPDRTASPRRTVLRAIARG